MEIISEETPLVEDRAKNGAATPTSSPPPPPPVRDRSSFGKRLTHEASASRRRVSLYSMEYSVNKKNSVNKKKKLIQNYKRDVEYNGGNHWSVIFTLYGSVWPSVLPWCLFVVLLTWFVWYLREKKIVDLSIQSNTGHGFMSIMVSFLIVTRTTISYNRFIEARTHLSSLYRSCREIVQYTCLLTYANRNEAAKAWRQEVAYRTIVSLRVTSAALEYRSKGVNTWEVIPDEEHEKTELLVQHQDGPPSELAPSVENTEFLIDRNVKNSKKAPSNDIREASHYRPNTDHFSVLQYLAHGPRTLTDENFRAPVVWAYNLREAILMPRSPKHSDILADRAWHVNESLKILGLVNDFVSAYHALKKLVVTPFPFPLVQMTRTFLFFWIFSVPLVIMDDNDTPYEVCALMFFITYGFLGLEFVALEIEDPYGSDPNDFPMQRWNETVFEDIYISIYKTDGFKSAMKLRQRISACTASGDPMTVHRSETRGGSQIGP